MEQKTNNPNELSPEETRDLIKAIGEAVSKHLSSSAEQFKWTETTFVFLVVILTAAVLTLSIKGILSDVSTSALVGSIIGYAFGRYKN